MRQRAKARLYVAENLAAARTVGLESGQAHYLRHVMRLGPGESVALFNGRDGEWLARIDGFGRGRCSLIVGERTRPQRPEPDPWLAFAPIKRARLDFLVQKAVELGASRLMPVTTRHTNVSRVNLDRIRTNAAEAAEQCERLTLPEVAEVRALQDMLADWPASRRLLLCAEAGPAEPVDRVLRSAVAEPLAWGIITGPEGGFSTEELDAFEKFPFVTAISLGPRILRAETAALAALSCWQSVLGDWHFDRV